jgi:glycosyltransferase involved in cell wall biosynthesis
MLEKAGYNVVRCVKYNDEIKKMSKLRLFCKTIWNREAYSDITELIKKHKPLVLHCHNTFPLISPSVYWAAAKQGVPVVQTLHNYRLLCINPYLYRNGKICEDCIGRSPLSGLIHRCYRGSFSASFTAFLMLITHRLLGTYRSKIDRYISLTEFGRRKFLEANLCDPSKVVVKPNAVFMEENSSGQETIRCLPEKIDTLDSYAIYVGRLSPEKGVNLLVDAWKLAVDSLPESSRLFIVGDGPEKDMLKKQPGSCNSIVFLGRRARGETLALIKKAKVLIVSSTVYETFGLTILEAASLGVPAIVSNIGGQAEPIEDGINGYVFKSGSAESLKEAVVKALSDLVQLGEMGRAARRLFLNSDSLTEEKNLKRLLEIYENIK